MAFLSLKQCVGPITLPPVIRYHKMSQSSVLPDKLSCDQRSLSGGNLSQSRRTAKGLGNLSPNRYDSCSMFRRHWSQLFLAEQLAMQMRGSETRGRYKAAINTNYNYVQSTEVGLCAIRICKKGQSQ